jgi:hypothetical protein
VSSRFLPRSFTLVAATFFSVTLLAASVAITPLTPVVNTGADRRFTAAVTGSTNGAVQWKVNGLSGGNSTLGTIDTTGTYRAPATPPASFVVTVSATSVADPAAVASTTVTVAWRAPSIASITPNPVPLGPVTLTVTGTKFVSGARVLANGTAIPTTYVSASSLTATGTATVAGTYNITVANPGPASVSPAFVLAVGTAAPPPPTPPPAPDPLNITYGRFLDQSSFGPTPASMARLRQLGIPAYLDEQFATPESPLPAVSTSTRDAAINAVFANQLAGNDQLRQRVLYALSEVIVISRNKNVNGDMIVPWLQILSRNAFGNYRTLLGEITLDSSMGMYLDMVNSAKPGLSGGANENYPRELMQLFSIGLVQLNADGSTKVDALGKPIPTYTQTDVAQLARAFTGWTYPLASGAAATGQRGSYYPGTMVPVASYHDVTAKTFLGKSIPANQSPKQDVDAALDILFQHPNLGPFVATRLIRALVTSNPSPQYVQRVATKFDNNGLGVRGDLTAVVRAILLDAEARNDAPPATFGRLRTPVQETIAMSRALGVPLGAASQINYLFAGMGEDELGAPSVFGHYSPMFRIPRTSLFGPEFQIYTATEAINRANFLYTLWFGSGGTLHPSLASYAAIAADPVALTTAVNNALLYGRMAPATRTAIQQSLPLMYDNQQRVLSALYLTVTSGEFLVQH